jgi:hypothetical protein
MGFWRMHRSLSCMKVWKHLASWDQWAGSEDKGACSQSRQPKFSTWDSHGGQQKCPVVSYSHDWVGRVSSLWDVARYMQLVTLRWNRVLHCPTASWSQKSRGPHSALWEVRCDLPSTCASSSWKNVCWSNRTWCSVLAQSFDAWDLTLYPRLVSNSWCSCLILCLIVKDLRQGGAAEMA